MKVEKSEEEWKKVLTPEQFRILRKNGTEIAGSGKFNKHFEKGTYTCAGCGAALFSSDTKFDSGTGWPSFFDVMNNQNVGSKEDRGLFMKRIEVHCKQCGGHLGHVFDDGPRPTGKRYCINSESLNFKQTH